MENENNVNREKEINVKQSINATRGAILDGLDSLPGDVEIYKCPKCEKIFLGADVLWKDMGNDVWEPFCENCEEQLGKYSKAN